MSRFILAIALIVLAGAIVFAALLFSDSDTEIPVLSSLLATETPDTDGQVEPTSTERITAESTSEPRLTPTVPSVTIPPTSLPEPDNQSDAPYLSDPIRITDVATGAFDPAWNPSGASIAFLKWQATGPCANRCADIGVVSPDGSNQGILADGPGPSGDIGIGGHIEWLGTSNLLLTNERNVFHEYMAIDSTMAPFSRTVFDGSDDAFTKILHIPGGMGGDGITSSRDGKTVLWRHREGASGTVSLRTASYNTLNGQNTNAIGTVLITDSTDAAAFANGVALSPGGDRYAFTWGANSTDGADLYVADAVPDGQLTRLTFNGDEGFTNRAPAFSPDGRFILFDALSDGQYDLWIIDVDMDETTRLTNTPDLHEANATWSPDGSRIAFQMSGAGLPTNIYVADIAIQSSVGSAVPPTKSENSGLVMPLEGRIIYSRSDPDFGPESILVMEADGSEQTVLIDDEDFNSHPVWSPDGSKIAYRIFGDTNSGIKIANSDGSNVALVAEFEHEPAWSPDGTKIAFSSARSGNFEIYTMNLDGSGRTQVTDHESVDSTPVWAPGGSQLAFESLRDGNSEIYLINIDGTGLTQLATNTGSYASSPSWSPDGTRIAFHSDRDIYVIRVDGSNSIQLTDEATLDIDPAWSPDGKHIVYTSGYQIWVMNEDGSGKTQLTDGEYEHSQPDWTR